MKVFRFLFSFGLTIVLTLFLNSQYGDLPPLGKFLDPFEGFWQNAYSENINPPRNFSLPELQNEASVHYDSTNIPHIYAQNDHDLYFLQGFVTAQERLWQMEFQALYAAGRLSEIFGSRTLELDRIKRRTGLPFGAENKLRKIMGNDTTANMVKSYAEGVNAYIQTLNYRKLPLEYKLLNYKPEKWTPLKTALLLQYMSENLSSQENDLENTNALKIFGKERFSFLFTDQYDDTEPIIPEKYWNFNPRDISKPQVEFPLFLGAGNAGNPVNKGSNNWAISGSKTSTGLPILANDPHLDLTLPSPWYFLHQKGPGVNVMGATLPGAPGVIVGFNDSIAWGLTNAAYDVKDWYKIRFNENGKSEYRFDNNMLKTQTRVETIHVKGAPSVKDSMIYTHFGPIVYDKQYHGMDSLKGKDLQNFALRWTAHDPSLEQLTFYELNRAGNYEDYKDAIRHFHNPPQNFVFASTNNNVAMWVQGKLPLKWEGQGSFLMNGSNSEMEWKGYIPQAHLPHILNPDRGFVSSANQYPVGSDYPYNMPYVSREHWRNKRINNMLEENNNISPEEVMNLQQDNYNRKAYEILPLMLDSIDIGDLNEEEDEIYEQLSQWNYYNNAGLKAPAYFKVWFDTLYKMVWDEFRNVDSMVLNMPSHKKTISIFHNNPEDTFFDIRGTAEKETSSILINRSFKSMAQMISHWQENHEKDLDWGNFKSTSISHLARISAFSKKNLQVGGGKNIINANGSNHGVSMRLVVSFQETGVKAWGIYAGGQSGNPGSPYYDNFIDQWSNGEYIPLKLIDQTSQSNPEISFIQRFYPGEQNANNEN